MSDALFSLQFFTFEQYKKLLTLTPLSPGWVSVAHLNTPEHTLTWKQTHSKQKAGGGRARRVLFNQTPPFIN